MSSTEDRAPGLITLISITLIFSTLALLLRFWSRSLITGTKYWWDDWMALLALPFYILQAGLSLKWTSIGLGKHVNDVDPLRVLEGLKLLTAGEVFYDIAISLPKLSALFFYARIFPRHSSLMFQRFLWILGSFVVAWIVTFVFLAIFQCSPAKKSWNPTLPGHCLGTDELFLGSAITSVVLDLTILLLPMPIIWRLQMKKRKKLLVMLVFLCGYVVIAISIGRLISVLVQGDRLDSDITWNVVLVGYFLGLEPSVSIVSVCLPSIFQLFRRGSQHGIRSLFTTKTPSEDPLVVQSQPKPPYNRHSEGFSRLRSRGANSSSDTQLKGGEGMTAKATGNPSSQNQDEIELESGLHHQVQVRKDVDVQAERQWTSL